MQLALATSFRLIGVLLKQERIVEAVKSHRQAVAAIPGMRFCQLSTRRATISVDPGFRPSAVEHGLEHQLPPASKQRLAPKAVASIVADLDEHAAVPRSEQREHNPVSPNGHSHDADLESGNTDGM